MGATAFPYLSRPLNFGHRGASALAPENTLAAFQKARDVGADGVELDVMLSGDGEVMVRHDDDLERTTDGHGRVRNRTLTELKALDAGSWFGPQFSGERIPMLREVCLWAAQDMLLNIELKSVAVSHTPLEEKTVAIVREFRLERRVVLSSFNPFSLRRVRQIAPDLHTGLLYAEDLPIYLRRAWLRPLARPAALHPHYPLVTDAYLDWTRRNGYRVNVWTVDDAAEMRRLIAQRVDMIITNQPDALEALL
jgi:glycerophosphoryl diester phosphodiesterase